MLNDAAQRCATCSMLCCVTISCLQAARTQRSCFSRVYCHWTLHQVSVHTALTSRDKTNSLCHLPLGFIQLYYKPTEKSHHIALTVMPSNVSSLVTIGSSKGSNSHRSQKGTLCLYSNPLNLLIVKCALCTMKSALQDNTSTKMVERAMEPAVPFTPIKGASQHEFDFCKSNAEGLISSVCGRSKALLKHWVIKGIKCKFHH